MRRFLGVTLTALLLVMGALVNAPAAVAEERSCRGLIGSVTVDNLGSVQFKQGYRATVWRNAITGDLQSFSNRDAQSFVSNRINGNMQ